MKHSKFLLFFIISAVLAVYARTAQILYLTEEKTGFFSADSALAALLLSVFIGICVASVAALAFFSRRTPKGAPRKTTSLCVLAGILSLSMLYESFFVSYISKATVLLLLTRLFAVLSATVFMLYALSPFMNEKKLPQIIFAVPVFLLIFKTVCVFTVYATVSTIADNIFYLCFLCGAILCFLFFAKIENGVLIGKSSYYMLPSVSAFLIVSLCCFVPQLTALIFGGADKLHCDYRNFPFVIASTAFFAVYAHMLYKRDNLKMHKRRTRTLKGFGTYDDYDSQFVTDDGKKK